MSGAAPQFNLREARTHLSKLVRMAAAGQEIIICRAGTPTARLVPLAPEKPERRFGVWRGKVSIHDDFDELPEDLAAAFRGEHPPPP